MGLADLDAFIDARRAPTNRVLSNVGTVDSLRATIEGDLVTVDGPAVGQPIPGAANSGFVTSSDVDIVGGATALIIELDLAEPFELARMASLSGSFYGPNQFGAGGARVFRALLQDDGDMSFGVTDDADTSEDDVITGTPVPDGARVLRWEWETGVGVTAKYATEIGGSFTTLGTNGTDTAAITSLKTGAVEEFGVTSRGANGDDGIPFMWSGCRVYADGVLVVDIRPDDLPDDSTATSITPTVGPALDSRLAGDGNAADLTLVIPAGQSMIVNPDESDSGNRVTTGQGIVTTASAVFNATLGGYILSEPDPALDITDDLCLVAYLADSAWGDAATTRGIVGKYETVPARRSYQLFVNPAGNLRFIGSDDGGSATVDAASSVVVPFSDGELGWVAVTVDGDNGASGSTIKFWTGGTGATPTWTQLGTDQTGAVLSMYVSSETGIEIGTYAVGDGAGTIGEYRYAAVYDGIGDHSSVGLGDLVFALDESDFARGAEGEASFPASTGQTVTVNGNVGWSVSAWEGVEPTATFDGTDDYESVPDEAAFDITGDIGFIAFVNVDQLPNGDYNIIGKYVSGNRSFAFRKVNDNRVSMLISSDGNLLSINSTSDIYAETDAVGRWVGGIYDQSAGEIKYWYGGTDPARPEWSQLGATQTGLATSAIFVGTAPIEIGSRENGVSNPFDGEIPYVAIYDGIGDGSAPGLGTLVFERNQVDIARAAAAGVGDGDTYPSASGHTVTSNGGVTYTGTAPLVIPRGTHALLGGTFVIGNQTGAQPYALNLGDYPNEWWGITRAAASDTARTYFDDGPAAASSGFAAFDPTELLAFFASLDWDADLIRFVIIDAAGAVVTATTASIAAIDRFIPTEGLAALYTGSGLPGALGSIVFDKRTTAPHDVTEGGEIATFATSLLTAYTPTVGDRRLGTPASISKRLN